jgi:5-bromo-4-chloroindolyl phosphate hydrolysis protein
MSTLTKERRTGAIKIKASLDEMAVTGKEINTIKEKLGETRKENWKKQAVNLRDLIHLKRVLPGIPSEK